MPAGEPHRGGIQNARVTSVQSAADSSRSVAEGIGELNGHADATFAASNEVLETTKRLFDHTRGVQSNVDNFLRHVRIA
jgi:hypothetical protein